MPDVRHTSFSASAASEIVRLLEISKGRAFCLFTSYAQMRDVYERVSARVRFPLLLQGTAPRSILLDRFRSTAKCRAVRHVQLLAGRRRARLAALLRDYRQAAVRGAQRSHRGRARARASRKTAATRSPNFRFRKRFSR